MPFVDLRPGRQRVARVQVERNVELFDRGPERPIALEIVVGRGVGIADLGKAVGERAAEAEITYAAFELGNGELRILHRQRSECRKTVRPLADLFGQQVIRLAGNFVRSLWVGDCLHGRRVEREDHDRHAVLVHLGKPLVVEIKEPRAQLRPYALRQKSLGIADRVVDCEMLFQPDLALHGGFSRFRGQIVWRACAGRKRVEHRTGACSRPVGALRQYSLSETRRINWWSQGESNPRPLECHSKDAQFLEFPGISMTIKKRLVLGLSRRTMRP